MVNGITIGMQQAKINKTIETTIIDQLQESFKMTVNGNRVSVFSYIGAQKDSLVMLGDGIMFIVPKRKKIIITLNGNDLYNVSLYNLRKFEYEKEVKDVYASQLLNTVFELLGVN